jgi:purine-binding chemotaxis protein CheW
MAASLLLVSIGGETAALETSAVQSVVELDEVNPIPCLPAHIEGLCALRSVALTVVNCRCALGLPPVSPEAEGNAPRMAVVVEIDSFAYALVVDAVADVIPFDQEPAEVRTKLAAGWADVSLGMVQTPSGPAQLIDPRKLVEGKRSARQAA